MKPLTKKAFKDLKHRKLRAALTIIGIALGVMGFSAIDLASNQVDSSYQYTFNAATTPDIQFTTMPAEASLGDLLAKHPNVMAVQVGESQTTRWAVSTGHVSLNIVGIPDFHNVQINKFELDEGNFPGPNQIVMESSNRQLAPVHIGDQITIEALGQLKKLTVSGFVRTLARPASGLFLAGLAYMNESDEEALFNTPGVNTYMALVKSQDQLDATAKQLGDILKAHHVLILNITVGSYMMLRDESGAAGIFSLLRVISIGAIVLSIFLLLSTVISVISEQVHIIGAMKAIGARRNQVMRSYLILVALYAVIGTIIGLGLGILVGYLLISLFANLLTMDIGPLTIDPSLVWASFLIGVGIPLLAALIPIYLGSRVSVRQAISGYGLAAGVGEEGSGWARAVRRFLRFIPQTVQLGIRNLFRQRGRTLLALLALAAAGTAFLTVQTTSYSLDQFANSKLYNSYNADLFVFLHNPGPSSQVEATLANVPGIKAVEQRYNGVEITQTGYGLLQGLEPDTQLYQKQVVAGRWFSATDQNVCLISQWTAQQTGLTVGGTVYMQDDVSSAAWKIIGIVNDDQVLGLPGGLTIVPLTEAKDFKHFPQNFATNLLIQSTSSNPSDIDALSSRVDNALSAAGFEPTITPLQQLKAQNESFYVLVYALLYTITVILTIVGALGLFNTLAMNVLERRREIGILRSMGATGGRIAAVFWTESIALGVLAWMIAAVLGIPAAYGFVALLGYYLFQVPFAFNPVSLVLMLLFIVIVASVASIGPVSAASRVRIAPTLRYE